MDLGTNTFNLLIAEPGIRGFEFLHSSKLPVKLGEETIGRNIISDESIDRALKALEQHQQVIQKYKAETTRVLATSAIRTASNASLFLSRIKEIFGYDIQVIDGEREAELIHKGIKISVPLEARPVLMLDIGGGSNELIIANNHKAFWSGSYPLGVARLLDRIRPSDPYRREDINELEFLLFKEMPELFEALDHYNPRTLIGASGSFESFYNMIAWQWYRKEPVRRSSWYEIPLADYTSMHYMLVRSIREERLKIPGLESYRVDMIVTASIIVNFILRRTHISRIIQTDYSLKEGVIAEIFEKS